MHFILLNIVKFIQGMDLIFLILLLPNSLFLLPDLALRL